MTPKAVSTLADIVAKVRRAWLSKRESVESRCTEISLASAISAVPHVDATICVFHGTITPREEADAERHSWLQCEGYIIDGTLEQFGCTPEVLVRPEADTSYPRYDGKTYLTFRPHLLLPLMRDIGLTFSNTGS